MRHISRGVNIKKRTKQQRIGEVGESIFETFALENGLIATKVKYDYGIDYICQVEQTHGATSRVQNKIIAANIKSSDAARVRAKYTRDDVEGFIRSDHPNLLILVDTTRRIVYYRFVDEELIREFFDKYKARQVKISLGASRMTTDVSIFPNILKMASSLQHINKIRTLALELKISEIVGNARIMFAQDSSGQIMIMEVDKLEDLLNDTENIRDTILCKDISDGIQLHDEYFKPELLNEIKTAVSLLIVKAREPVGQENELVLSRGNENISSCLFEIRTYRDEVAFHHATGFTFILSESRKDNDGKHYHAIEIKYDDEKSDHLFSHSDIFEFLSNCAEEKDEIVFSRDATEGILLSQLPELLRLGIVVRSLRSIYTALAIGQPTMILKDINNPNYSSSFSLLQGLVETTKDTHDIIPAITLTPNIDTIIWHKAMIKVPTFIIIPEGRMLLANTFMGSIGKDADGGFKGFRLDYLEDVQVIDTECDFDSGYPLLIINKVEAVEYSPEGFKIVASPIDMNIEYQIYNT